MTVTNVTREVKGNSVNIVLLVFSENLNWPHCDCAMGCFGFYEQLSARVS